MKKIVNLVSIIAILSIAICSCDKKDDTFKGKNEIFLSLKGDNTIIETEDTILDVDLILTRPAEESLELTFQLTSDIDNEIIELENPSITILAGDKTATLKIKSLKKEILIKKQTIKLSLLASSDENISLNSQIDIIVKPSPAITPLTEKQNILLEKYKTELGLDLSLWIGAVPVQVEVYFPGGGYLAPFTDAYTKNIQGKTIISLSENANAQKPILVMTDNAMGLQNYLHQILKEETYLDADFWTQQPAPQKSIKILELSADRDETFILSLDRLKFNTQNKTIDFVSNDKAKDSYGDFITAVGFDYSYSPWDRMKQLIQQGNQEIISAQAEGGSLNPDNYLNITNIDSDEWETGNWQEPSSSYDTTTGQMKFVFNIDHANCGDYIKMKVTFTSASK